MHIWNTKRVSQWMGALLIALVCQSAHASLELVGGFNTSWNRVTNPGTTDPITLLIRHTGSGDDLLTSYNMGIKITGGSGTLAIAPYAQQGALFPTLNPVFSSYVQYAGIPGAPYRTTNAGVEGMTFENTAFVDVAVPASGRNAVTLRFYSPADDAAGTFSIWASSSYSSYFTTENFDGLSFSNASQSDLLLGTITVTAVPEPTSIMGLAICAGVWLCRRRK